ncbi:MAG: uracil-DNA glycosylase [Bdellovibrionota bacterium]
MPNTDNIKLEPEWKVALGGEFEQPYMKELRGFLRQETASGQSVFPRGADIFNAFTHTPFSQVKVVIIGQDPYHGPGQAHGLSFSVRDGVPPPPSLKNIYKEIHADLGLPIPKTGNLTPWADQGVLLLNAVLTVREATAGSHRNRGWEKFTDRVIQVLSERDDPIVFILWGAFAQSKEGMIRQPPHAVIKSAHPSPLSAHNGFHGSRPFSRANALLKKWGKKEIDWRL